MRNDLTNKPTYVHIILIAVYTKEMPQSVRNTLHYLPMRFEVKMMLFDDNDAYYQEKAGTAVVFSHGAAILHACTAQK